MVTGAGIPPATGLRSAVAACLAAVACGSPPETPSDELEAATAGFPACTELRLSEPRDDTSLVLVVNDTMRRDRVGAYGGTARTPHFDAFARRNLLFRNVVSQAPWTKPAIATLFTGLYPSQHGVLDDPRWRAPDRRGWNRADVIGDELVTLAEVLRARGFRTAAFVSNPWMERRFGFDQGFETYDDSFARWDAAGEVVSEAALGWLAQRKAGERFFLYLHYLDSHRPYGALSADTIESLRTRIEADERPLPKRDDDFVAALKLADGRPLLDAGVRVTPTLIELAYDLGLEEFDTVLGALLGRLAELPAYERTAIVVTSDHGEALYERGYGNHGLALHGVDIAVPLAARLPGVRADDPRVDCATGLVDLLPSLCTYLGARCPPSLGGRSWFDEDERGQRHYLIAEAVQSLPRSRSIQNERYKLIFEPDGRFRDGGARVPSGPGLAAYSLFDLDRDPEEKVDLLSGADPPARVREIARRLDEAMRHAVAPVAVSEPETAPIGPEMRERLEALGYAE